jgi:hypothetical protein
MKFLILVTAAMAVFSVSGCATHTQREDYAATPNGDAILQVGTMPKQMMADFYLNDSAESCSNFRNAGYVYDWDAENSNWLDTAARALSFTARDEVKSIKAAVTSGRPIQIAGRNLQDGFACGPVVAQFEPIRNHRYQAYFVMWEQACRMEVVDVTEPGKQILANGFKSVTCNAVEWP